MPAENDPEREDALSATQRRIRSTIDALLEDEGLSPEARQILSHLKASDSDLAEISAEELRELLLEGLP